MKLHRNECEPRKYSHGGKQKLRLFLYKIQVVYVAKPADHGKKVQYHQYLKNFEAAKRIEVLN